MKGSGGHPPRTPRRGPRPRPGLPLGPYLVVGLARSGVAAMRMLAPHGEVIGVDSGDVAVGGDGSFEVHSRTDGIELLDRVETVVKSPGVPQDAPVIEAARARGMEVTGELELAWRLMPDTRFIAVTGTNGKTTTVELLGAATGAAVAGNVGTALGSLVEDPPPLVVCEVSSFQLEDASQFAPEVAVLINLGEDHLDRHGTVEAYQAAKMRVFANQTDDDVAVAPLGLRVSHGVATGPRSVTFGGHGADLEHAGDRLLWRGEPLIATADIRLRGAHNLENAMAAAAAALANGTDADTVCHALSTFAGVPHRLEEVAERDGVFYVNDSKATNVAAATVALEAFAPGTVHAILGGILKGGGFAGLRAPLAKRAKAAYLIGEAADRLAADLDGAVPLHRAGDLPTAVRQARANATPGDVILLSPATASYDQYENFERRGEHFRELARG
jgi:UDP-N-acetylmuramoylalanine--D-glutamate ligase